MGHVSCVACDMEGVDFNSMKPNQHHPLEDKEKKTASIAAHADDAQTADKQEQHEQGEEQEVDEDILAGVSVIRGNTPRPFSFETLKSVSGHFQRFSLDEAELVTPVFPMQAPLAPPLPEELGEQDGLEGSQPTAPSEAAAARTLASEAIDQEGAALAVQEAASPIQIPAQAPAAAGASRLGRAQDESAVTLPENVVQGETVAVTPNESIEGEHQDRREGVPEDKVERRLRRMAARDAQEFLWLFEYGLEMDASILNSPERLARLALPYGPGLLKGYKLMLGAQSIHGSSGPTIAAIVPDPDPDAEVWGMLYRIPRRVTESNGDEPSLLDTIHAAITPQKFFKGVEVVVRETYRERDVTSVTYVATEMAANQLHLVEAKAWDKDPTFLRRLAAIAQRQKLPLSYIEQFVHNHVNREHTSLVSALPSTPESEMGSEGQGTNHTVERSQHVPVSEQPQVSPDELHLHASHFAAHATIPLSALGDGEAALRTPVPDSEARHGAFALPRHGLVPATDMIPRSVSGMLTQQADPWLLSFALYLVFLLLLALTFAVLQGLGLMNGLFNRNFMPLGVPWLVMMYGLLGGCISSIVTLSRFRSDCPPAFIIITWFTRPFIGSILAVLSYVLLASGVFDLNTDHMPLFLLAGALAGLTEGWIFFKRSR